MEKILATSPLCGPCKVVKKYLEDNKIEVTIKDVSEDLPWFKENGINSVPVLIIKNDNATIKLHGSPDIIGYLEQYERKI